VRLGQHSRKEARGSLGLFIYSLREFLTSFLDPKKIWEVPIVS